MYDERAGTRSGVSAWAGWVVFAGITLVMVGLFHATMGLVALFNHGFYTVSRAGLLVPVSYTTWGWSHIVLGAVGLVLALNGWYRPVLAFPIGGAAWLGVLALARPVLAGPERLGSTAGHAHAYAAFGVAAIVAITGWNLAHASTHVLIDRDGGSYANTGRWIARDGSLAVKPGVGPFAREPTVGFDSQAVYQMPDGALQFQFAHLLPVILAEAHAIAGDRGLFHAPELLGGFALLGPAQRVGADQDADGEVAEHRRQVHHAEGDHAQHGAAQQYQG